MSHKKHNYKGSKKKEPNFTILHECLVCGYKWEQKFNGKRCHSCGYDEREKDALKAISRVKVKFKKCPDGELRIPIKIVKVVKEDG